MKKRLAILVTVIFLLAGIVYEYMHLHKEQAPANAAITAIPIDASFIFEGCKNFPLWNGISKENSIWKDLLGTEPVSELDRDMKYLDSAISIDPKVRAIAEDEPIFISAHKNGMEHFDYLFTCLISNAKEEEELHSFMEGLGKNGSFTQSEYDGIIEYCLKMPGKSNFYYSVNKGIFIGSLVSELVQESLRQMESGILLMDNSHFRKVLAASSGQPVAQVFINYQFLYNAAEPFMNKDFHSYLSSLQDFAQWTALDISITPDEVIMNGFTEADSSGGQFISLFNHQSSQTPHIVSVAPANTSLITCFEITDNKAFIKDYKKYLGLHRRLIKHSEWVEGIEKAFNVNIEKSFYSWLDNEVALVITEPSDSTLQNDTYAIIGAGNTKNALKELKRMADSIRGDEDKHFEAYQYMGHTIGYIALENMLPNLLGGAFNAIKQTYYADIGDYIVFANNTQALELFINRYEGGSTLAKDEYYQEFAKEHIENEAGVYIYNNVALSPMLYEQYLNSTYAEDVKKHIDITRKMQAVGIQFNYMQGMFYTNIYFKRNAKYKKQTGALWQTALDTVLTRAPEWVADYKTKGQFVFEQDKANNVYLLGSNGHIVWEKELDESVMGQVYAVDAMKNEKTQVVFNSREHIYGLDGKGKNLYGLPVTIPSKATAPIAVFDYDDKRAYRIVVPCGDDKIRMYDVSGKSVKDWKAPETDDDVKCPLQYVKIDDKDFIIAVDDGGKVYVFDRKGKSKVDFKNKLPAHIKQFKVMVGKQESETYVFAADSTGTIYQLSLTDYLTHTKYMKDNIHLSDFAPVDLEGNGSTDMVMMSKYEVCAYKLDGTELFHLSERDSLKDKLITLTYSDGKTRMGAVDAEKNKIYLWDSKGDICNGFPLYGSTAFSIADMNNDGQFHLLTAAGKNVYVYSLP